VRVEFTGLRQGEKLFEELAFSGEQATKTRHEKVFIGKLEAYPEEKVQGILTRLGAVTETSEAVNVREVLKVLLPEFSEPMGEISSAYRIPGDVLEVTPARGVPRV
jgi:FlaA1/EpsC-like NDP-sugar epimerase